MELLSKAGKVLTEGDTDAQGRFSLVQFTSDVYTLQVTEAGFREARQSITQTSAREAPIVITLQIDVEQVTVDVEVAGSSSKVSTDIAPIRTPPT